jgi:propanediol dehydratase large subunit
VLHLDFWEQIDYHMASGVLDMIMASLCMTTMSDRVGTPGEQQHVTSAKDGIVVRKRDQVFKRF